MVSTLVTTSASCWASEDFRRTIFAEPAAVLAVSSLAMSFSMVAILSAGAETISRLVAGSGTIRSGVLAAELEEPGGLGVLDE